VRVDEILEQVDVFVVDVLNVILRENIIGCHIVLIKFTY
jgi:hypothetical protein